MKLLFQGDKGKAICEHCGVVSVTYRYRDVPLSGSGRLVKNILAGVCDQCDRVASIPAQSTPAIKTEREKATRSIEAVLPSPYLDVLDLAAYKLLHGSTTEMRKYLLLAYLNKARSPKQKPSDWTVFEKAFNQAGKQPTKRFSIKVSPQVEDDFLNVQGMFSLSKTDTLKSIIFEIKQDILDKELISPEVRFAAKLAQS